MHSRSFCSTAASSPSRSSSKRCGGRSFLDDPEVPLSLFELLSRRVGDVLDDLSLPDRLRAQLDEAERALSTGSIGAARAVVLARGVLSQRSENTRALWVLARAHEALAEWGAAAGAWLELVRLRDNLAARTGLARCAIALDDLGSAVEHLRAAIDMTTHPADRNELRLALAEVHVQRHRPEAAAPLLRLVLREEPTRGDVALRLANVLQEDDDLDGALATLLPRLDEHPDDPALLRLCARLYEARRASDDDRHAARLWEHMLALRPDDAEALLALGRLHLRRGRLAESLPHLQHALAVADLDAHAAIHSAIGEANARCHQWRVALESFRAAVALDGSNAVRWGQCARAAWVCGLLPEADAASAQAWGRSPTREHAALRGQILLALDQVDEARELLTPLRAARMAPDELHALGALALRSGDTTEAVALLREAALHDGTRDRVEGELAEAFRRLAPVLPEAIQPDPESVSALLDAMTTMVAGTPLLADLASRLATLRQHLETPLSIAVMGEFNAGKSTLINAFVGEEMLATGVLPTTSHINVVRWGPRRTAHLVTQTGERHELPFAEAAVRVKRDPESIAELAFQFPHPDLRAVHFWDTPGLNAPDAAHEERAREAMRRADAVLWLLDVHQALSATELARLQEIRGAADKVIVVVNKVDRLGDDADALAEVLAHVRRPLEGHVAAILPISGRNALRAQAAAIAAGEDALAARSAQDELARTGWTALRDEIRARFEERTAWLKSTETLRSLAETVDTACVTAAARRDQLAQAREAIAALRASIEREGRAFSAGPSLSLLESARAHVLRQRERLVVDLDGLLGPAQGIFGRRRIARDDARATLRALRKRLVRAWDDEVDALIATMEPLDASLAAGVEGVAQLLGPPESRTERGRLEAWMVESASLRALLRERLVAGRRAVVETRLDLEGPDLLVEWPDARSDEARAALLQRLLPLPDEGLRVRSDAWGREYLEARARLCDHVTRDLDMLALDLEHRIIQPLETLRARIAACSPTSLRPST